VFLAGDAAHRVTPRGGTGLNLALHDGYDLGWKLAWVLRGWAGPGLLDSYDVERRAAAQENLAVTSATMDFLVPQTPEAHAHRRSVLEAALEDPAARAQVDSGRLAEPFWYVDSPLTTPCEDRPWPGRPERGRAPAPVPGVVLPDGPAADPADPSVRRVRELARSGLLALTGPAADAAACAAALKEAVPAGAPVRVLPMADVDVEGVLSAALGAADDEVWLVRPDAHVAACVRTPADLAAAARRTLAL
jgi:pentachlorophenol monooxygenase/3-(3-hydroxy-phenyl)propionate hydroxylase